MSIPEFPKFKPIELADQAEVKTYLNAFSPSICEMNFVNLYVWRNSDFTEASILNGNLCIRLKPKNEPPFFFAPIGKNKIKETIKDCFNLTPRFSRVPEEIINQYFPVYFSCDRSNFDYVYLTKDLAELAGKDFDAKRNFIKRFSKNHPFAYKKITKEDGPACLELLKTWEEGKKHLTDFTIRSQKDAVKELFSVFEKLDVFGGAILIDSRLEAFAIGSRLNAETADIHFEIANSHFTGLSQAINNLFVKNELGGYKFINREQDMGLPGLRKAKLSYHPHHLEKKFDVVNML